MEKDKKALAAEAQKVSKRTNCNVIYGNPIGEFFTSENLAHLSVGGDKEKITTYDFNKVPTADAGDDGEKEKVALIKNIAKAKTVDAAKALLTDDADVIEAVESRVEELEATAKAALLVKISKAKTKEAAEALLVGYEDDADVTEAVEKQVAKFTPAA